MEGFRQRLEAVVAKITTLFTWISGLTIFAMMFLIVIDVAARYLFRSPLKGAMDLGQMMLILIGFLGMAYTQAEKGHVRVVFVTDRLSLGGQRILEIITSLLGTFIMGLIAVRMAGHGIDILASPEAAPKTNLLFIPHSPFILIAALGCLMFSVRLLLDGIGLMVGVRSRDRAEEGRP